MTTTSDIVVIQSHGMGVESQAILERWVAEPETRPFRDWSQLIVVTAQVGEEHKNDTIRDMEARTLPMLRELGIRFVEVARRGAFEKDGIVVLQDTRQPVKLHPDGVYRLSDELLRSGTVPQFGGEHRCAMKFKAFVIEAWLAFEFQRQTPGKPVIHVFGYNAEEVSRSTNSDHHIGRHNAEREIAAPKPPLMVFGFNSEECGRINRARKYDGPSRIGNYPLQEWGWDRKKCIVFIRERSGIDWRKSHCSFCPFCAEASRGDAAAVLRWTEAPEQTAHGVFVEFNSLCFNPRGQLYKKSSLAAVIQAKAKNDGRVGPVLVEFARILERQEWAIYKVRRIYTKKGKAFRCVERLETGGRAEMEVLLRSPGYCAAGDVQEQHGIHYHYFTRRKENVYPAAEGYFVVAPAVMETKLRGKLEVFNERFGRVITE